MPPSLILLALLVVAAPAVGAMHKCVDADGNITYSQAAWGEASPTPPGGLHRAR
jgi:hypothetical protein